MEDSDGTLRRLCYINRKKGFTSREGWKVCNEMDYVGKKNETFRERAILRNTTSAHDKVFRGRMRKNPKKIVKSAKVGVKSNIMTVTILDTAKGRMLK